MRRSVAGVGVVVLLPVIFLLLWAASPAGAQLPFTVTNDLPVARVGELVTTGVPIRNLVACMSTAGFTVIDDTGAPVPAQFKVLGRWHGSRDDTSKRLKWVLVSFPATVPAASSRVYTLNLGLTAPGALSVTDGPSFVTVNTGAGLFTVSRTAFTLLQGAVVQGTTVLSGGGALEMVDSQGTNWPVALSSTVIEEQGSVRAVICQRGVVGPLRFTCRTTFATGRSDVGVDFRLENPGAYGAFFGIPSSHQYFDSLYLRLPVSGGVDRTVTTDAVRILSQGDLWRLSQSFTWTSQTDLLANFAFTEFRGDVLLASGGRYEGAVAAGNGGRSITAAVDRFWQSHPKSFVVDSTSLRIGLFPEWGSGPHWKGQYASPSSPVLPDPLSLSNYRFEGGRWKTHRFVVDFRPTTVTPAEVTLAAKITNRPLMGMLHPHWYFRQHCLSNFHVEARNWPGSGWQRYERLMGILAKDSPADDIPGLGIIGLPKFRNRGGTYGGWDFYGWFNFGDLVWGDGYASLHYDWPFNVLLNYWRTGDYAFFDAGRDMAAFRRDIAQNHSTDPVEFFRGAQNYEKGWWHGNYQWGVLSHNWVAGLLLYHMMTGDEGAREAAVENGSYLLRMRPDLWDGQYGERLVGWSIDNLVELYNYLGDSSYLDMASAAIQRFQTFEQQYGGQGYVFNAAGAAPSLGIPAHASIWQHNVVFLATCKYLAASLDTSVLPLLQRMTNFFKTHGVEYASGPIDNLSLPKVRSDWAPGWDGGTSIHLAWPMADALAWAGGLFGDTVAMNLAGQLFETVTRYHQRSPGAGPVDVFDSGTWSAISARMTMYPNAESKILGNIGKWGGTYMALRLITAQGFYAAVE